MKTQVWGWETGGKKYPSMLFVVEGNEHQRSFTSSNWSLLRYANSLPPSFHQPRPHNINRLTLSPNDFIIHTETCKMPYFITSHLPNPPGPLNSGTKLPLHHHLQPFPYILDNMEPCAVL